MKALCKYVCLISAAGLLYTLPAAAQLDDAKEAAENIGDKIGDGAKAIGDGAKGLVNKVRKAPASKKADDPVAKENLQDAALSPLGDLNVRKRDVPKLLLDMSSPYEQVADRSCAGLKTRVLELDAVLGPDMDAPKPDMSSDEKTDKRRKDLSVAAVASGAGSLIPFRGLVREATGASARDREIRRQYQKGVARRAYLKGIGKARGCSHPAAPL